MKFEIVMIAVFVSAACAIPGVFLVLRRMALMSDAISHSVLLGIVIVFFLSGDLHSPVLMTGAVLMGIITVLLTESLVRTGLVFKDAAIGLVFPALFSIAVIIISLFAENIHLDTDAVLLGEIAFAPLDRISLWGTDLGPKSAWVMGTVLLINLGLLFMFFKELKMATFDSGLAASLGFSPILIHYGLMLDVSITVVGAFDAVGSILVVALIVAPASAAYLLTNDLKKMIFYSIVIGALSSVSGFAMGWWLDASIGGGMATMAGVFFLLAFLFAPEQGLLSTTRRKERQKVEFGISMLSVHLLNHRNSANAAYECSSNHLMEHINWNSRFAKAVIFQAKKQGYINQLGDQLILTESGEKLAAEAML